MLRVVFLIEGEFGTTIIIIGRPATEELDNQYFKTLLVLFGIHSYLYIWKRIVCSLQGQSTIKGI